MALSDRTSTGTRPHLSQQDAIIYEAHVRGLTAHPSTARLATLLAGIKGFEQVGNIPASARGTYRGAGLMAPYLKALGYTTIELLPIMEANHELNPAGGPGGNFWGYMTYGWFAPDRHYSSDQSLGGPTREFKQMVAAFHRAGLEVYLDVVYNHSGEGGTRDQTRKAAELTSLRGLDNATYYALPAGDPSGYFDTTGTGNNHDASQADYSMPMTLARPDGSGGFDSRRELAGRVYLSGSAVGDQDPLVLTNQSAASVRFTLPPAPSAARWVRLVDTLAWAEPSGNAWDLASAAVMTGNCGVNPRSVVVLVAR